MYQRKELLFIILAQVALTLILSSAKPQQIAFTPSLPTLLEMGLRP